MATRKPRAGSYKVELVLDDMALNGWLPIDLAKEAGISDMTVSRFLSGETQTPRTAKKIAAALGHEVSRYYVPHVEAA